MEDNIMDLNLDRSDKGENRSEKDDKADKQAPAKYIQLQNFTSKKHVTDRLHANPSNSTKIGCMGNRCAASLMQPASPGYLIAEKGKRSKEQIFKEATEFLQEYYKSKPKSTTDQLCPRLSKIHEYINITGTYDLTYDELKFAAKSAWRNAPRCIGRIQWKNLEVIDARKVETAQGMFEVLCKHLQTATNGGNIRSVITVFRQRLDNKGDFRLWNSQLIRYAGYKQPNGSVIGDPINVEFTQTCEDLGWKGKGEMFDVLPLILQADGKPPEWFEIPPKLILEVQLTHPKYDWFSKLGLKWYAVPCVADMQLDAGGLQFTAAPFNGWYMGSEVGARNFCDSQRYNMLETISNHMGLDTSSNTSLWKDRALVETNIAVLHSYKTAKVTMMDHHSAAESFMQHMENEQRLRGGCPADWVWIVPPLSGSVTPVFHQEMISYQLKPAFFYQVYPGKEQSSTSRKGKPLPKLKIVATAVRFLAHIMRRITVNRPKATILYATETGKSERFARRLDDVFNQAFNVQTICMEDYDTSELCNETFLLFVTSTFGNGEPPANGEDFLRVLKTLQTKYSNRNSNCVNTFTSLRFSVFGLGSTAYPDFCAFACTVDTLLSKIGAKRLMDVRKADELSGEEEAFKGWGQDVFRNACEVFTVHRGVNIEAIMSVLGPQDGTEESETYRLTNADRQDRCKPLVALEMLHGKKVYPCRMVARKKLQSPASGRSTILVQLNTNGASELIYQPGDHVVLFPTNDRRTVHSILDKIKTDQMPLSIVQLEKNTKDQQNWKPVRRLPPCSVLTALFRYLDITTPPTTDFLRLLANFANDLQEQENILQLAKGGDDYRRWISSVYPNLLDVFNSYPSINVSAWFLLAHLPLLKPRYYSISSSPKLYPNEIHITVAVVNYWTTGNSYHKGVCSSWLDEVRADGVIPAFIKKAHSFHLPKDTLKPVILVGPGTGIAPFRSFWQHRYHQIKTGRPGQASGKMILLFGCRHPDIDDIYQEETEKAAKAGALSQVLTAYSRVPGKPKKHVQQILKKKSAHVFKYLYKEQGHFYVCGDNLMAVDVCKTLVDILKAEGNMTSQEAESYIGQMRDSGRYHEDVFGVVIRAEEKTTPAPCSKFRLRVNFRNEKAIRSP